MAKMLLEEEQRAKVKEKAAKQRRAKKDKKGRAAAQPEDESLCEPTSPVHDSQVDAPYFAFGAQGTGLAC